MEVNGKVYTLWGKFVEEKACWIGGFLQEIGDPDPVRPTGEMKKTKITDIELVPNGSGSAFFRVKGEDYNCGFDVRHGGVFPLNEPNKIHFSGYMNHRWSIERPPPN